MRYIGAKHRRLDVLVNNAGVTGFHQKWGLQDPEHATLKSWRAVHAVNLDGVFLGCKHAIPLMKESKAASIINISSIAGLIGIPMAAAYASSKAGVRNHTKTVALYCAEKRYPIRCNSIHPGAIQTPIWDPLIGKGPEVDSRIKLLIKDTPLKRFGTPEEVAAAVLFLASSESTYITGTELYVDGGSMAGKIGSY